MMRAWNWRDDLRFWLGGKLFKLALNTLPDCASKHKLADDLDGMFWVDPNGRIAKRKAGFPGT